MPSSLLGFSLPKQFLNFRVDRIDVSPTIVGACVGYELGTWRSKALAKHLLQWLPEFALSFSECSDLDAGSAFRQVGEAALSVYKSPKYETRGEFGEVLLHAVLRHRYDTVPLISKIYFKDSPNENAKGFDAVHVAVTPAGLELWLGEAKFYADIYKAIADACSSLKDHFGPEFLKQEFIAVRRKIDPKHPLAAAAEKLFEPNLSLDDVVESVHVPVLLTYNSPVVKQHTQICDPYIDGFTAEVDKHHKTFCKQDLPKKVTIHLILVPLLNKATLVKEMDELLKSAQDLA